MPCCRTALVSKDLPRQASLASVVVGLDVAASVIEKPMLPRGRWPAFFGDSDLGGVGDNGNF
jgi:hypothetical protein